MDSFNDMARPTPTLLGIPVEVRLMIYDYLTEFTSTITIFSQFEVGNELNEQKIDLMHVCGIIRKEVQDAFYRNQTFEFRSHQAIQTFCKSVSPYHLSIIRNVELGYQLSRRRIDFFKREVCDALQNQLTGVERLTITNPNLSYLTRFTSKVTTETYNKGYEHRAGAKIAALRAVSAKLASGNLYHRYEINDSHLMHWQNILDQCDHITSSKLVFVPRGYIYPRNVRGSLRGSGWAVFHDLTCYDPVA